MRLKRPSVNVSCHMTNMKPATNTKPKSLPGSAHTCRLQLQTVITLTRSGGGLGTVSGLRRLPYRDYLSSWKQSGCLEYLVEFPSPTKIVKRGSNSDHHQQWHC